MKILLLSRYSRLGASSRIRFYQYLPYLKEHGIDVTVAPLLKDKYIDDLYAGRHKNLWAIFRAYLQRLDYLLKSRHFDLLWIEKELFPWLPALGETMLTHLGIPYVVDYDDAVFHSYDMHTNGVLRTFFCGKIDAVMRHASLVIVGNSYLADRAWRVGAKQVEYLPTAIDLDRYCATPQTENAIFTIGWIGSPTTVKYLNLVRPALFEVCNGGNTRLMVVGSGNVELDGVPLVKRGWAEDTEVANIQSFDVGIMPLPDNPWEHGKCGYKLIQYMACGQPVVASPVGVNKQIIEDGVNGFLAATMADWVCALNALRDNYDLRGRMGRVGRKKVESEYCLQVTAPRLVSLLGSVVNRLR